MGSLDESFVFNSFNLEVNFQREAIQFRGMTQSNGGMDLRVGSGLVASLASHKLEGAQEARWKHG